MRRGVITLAVVALSTALGFWAGRWKASSVAPQAASAPGTECGQVDAEGGARPAAARGAPTERAASSEPAILKTASSSSSALRPPGSTAPAEPRTDPWSSVPLDRVQGSSLGSFTTRKAVSEGITSYSRASFARCFEGYAPPAGLDKYTLTIELRLVATDKEFVVEDAVPLEANYGDERLERCILDNHRGRRIAAVPETPGRYRLEWKSIRYFGSGAN